MTATQSPVRNGVDTGTMFATLDLIKDQPALASGLLSALVVETTEGLYRCEARFGNW